MVICSAYCTAFPATDSVSVRTSLVLKTTACQLLWMAPWRLVLCNHALLSAPVRSGPHCPTAPTWMGSSLRNSGKSSIGTDDIFSLHAEGQSSFCMTPSETCHVHVRTSWSRVVPLCLSGVCFTCSRISC